MYSLPNAILNSRYHSLDARSETRPLSSTLGSSAQKLVLFPALDSADLPEGVG